MNKPITGAEGWRWDIPAVSFRLASVAGLALLALYFWQVFVTMPHVVRFYRDSEGYLDPTPFRGLGLYSFIKFVLWFWNDFYAVAVAQDMLLALNAALLAYAVWRLTRSGVLMLTPLLVCLFKTSIIEHAQGLSTDSLFPIICVGVMACALLLYENVSPWRIAGFLLFGFFACFLRTIGEVILWSLLLVLALRLWPQRRRALGVLAAGCLGIHALIAGISYINYGTWVPQAQAGPVLIIAAAFIADENVPPDAAYPHDFVAATASMRSEYNKALTWPEKYEVMDRYTGSPIQDVAIKTLLHNPNYVFDRKRYEKYNKYGSYVALAVIRNEVLEQAALTIIRQSPHEYVKMVLVNLLAGIHMFTSYDYALDGEYNSGWTDHIARISEAYTSTSNNREMLPLIEKLTDDWRNTPLDLKSDIARPLRAFFGLGEALSNQFTRSPLRTPATHGGTLNWLFIIESALVLLLTARRLLRRQPIGDRLGVLLLFIVPTWAYVFVLCLMVRPYGTYMDATSLFVYLALLIGGWLVIATAAKRVWRGAASLVWNIKMTSEHRDSAAA